MLAELRRIVQAVNTAERLQEGLEIIVERVSEVMNVEVCSVYLLDRDSGRYTFQANRGLNPKLVGKISLAPDEGLVGAVARREELLNLSDAENHPDFHFLEGIGEELFHSFLGVPIIHQRRVVGVLVVQQRDSRRFTQDEEAFLVTLSVQLAGEIAHARASAVVANKKGRQKVAPGAEFMGVAGAPGVAIGTAVLALPKAELHAVPSRRCDDVAAELAFFHRCLDAVREDIRQLSKNLEDHLPPEEQALFNVYLNMLNDKALAAEVDELIEAGEWAQGALAKVMLEHVRRFELMEDSYFQERATDVKDLGRRVLSYLQASDEEVPEYPENTVLVGEELSAAMLGEVPPEKLAGLVSMRGSGSSHVAILARAMGIPTVMGAADLPFTQIEDSLLIVNGYDGIVYYRPRQRMLKRFKTIIKTEAELSRELDGLRDLPCETLDGHRLPLLVNTGLMADVRRSLHQGAEGVGLYRTEVPFLLRERFPTEEEQAETYREKLDAFSPRPVVMRTLDIGGDKALPYFDISEENPFLGWRGIRVTLDHPEIFLAQVRAMLRASDGYDNLQIMLPMISGVKEFDDAYGLILRAREELMEEGLRIKMPPVGVMIEVPSAVYQARALARRADFLSVGSNDLTQYLLAVDRNNARVAGLYHAYHPAVLHALKDVAAAGQQEGKPVSICGELAGDPGAALLLVAMGFGSLSMNASSLLRVKSVLRSCRLDDMGAILNTALQMDTAEEIKSLLRKTVADLGEERLLQPHLASVP